MRSEQEQAAEDAELLDKNNLFAHAVINGNPELYFKLFPQEFGISPEEEQGLDWEIPQTPGDVDEMIAELQATGWDPGRETLPWAAH